MNCNEIINKLRTTQNAEKDELVYLLDNITDDGREVLRRNAQEVAQEHFGNKIFIRGLIEISSFCKNDCLYCGIRRSNKNAVRYRLS
ncbi:MAG: [FeFe] hydrogenase H-cluster radical SAM maturase HydE, partial [Eubacteriales bacterium]|nr:[FeFe] hydrogenase H-cluster radical SAM maturase HydE [Eubacteriales bacterium]